MNTVPNRPPIFAVWLAAALGAAFGLSSLTEVQLGAQPKDRRNRLIEALENGRTAITGETWAFVDREHRPYDVTELRATLTKMLANKNAQGQPALAPIVRIPAEGDQDVRWIIKQVLESGAMGIIVAAGRERRAGAEGHPIDALPAAARPRNTRTRRAGAGAGARAAPDGACRTRRTMWRAPTSGRSIRMASSSRFR